MQKDISAYNDAQVEPWKGISQLLAEEIQRGLPEADSKIWHGHPVWFLNGNPIAGYSLQKKGMRLMFWSGKSFNESGLDVLGEKFQDASAFYKAADEINTKDLERWLEKSKTIQWDYKNIIRRKGVLERLS